jgi:2-keto-4-pentenoate hydratase
MDDLLAGPHLLGPGIEVIDYRTVDSKGAIDWIADNSTVAYAVVGDLIPVSDVDAAAMEVRLSSGDAELATGRGSKVMGNPLAAVAWLSGHLSERGRSLEEGAVVLTGSLTGHHLVTGPDTDYRADFGELGQVSVSFTN